jgi:hypothetical protein
LAFFPQRLKLSIDRERQVLTQDGMPPAQRLEAMLASMRAPRLAEHGDVKAKD